MILTAEEIAQFRAQVQDMPGAIAIFKVIEDCEGDMEDAAITLALQSGQEPDHSDGWLQDVTKRWRHVLCQTELQADLQTGAIAQTVQFLMEETSIPKRLAIPVAICAAKTDLDAFCKAFEPIETTDAD